MSWIWPIITGHTFFDYWSIAHFAFWWFVASTLVALKVDRSLALASCMMVAYLWEIFEHFASKRWPTIWLSPESWVNALISDPLMCFVAVVIAYHGFNYWRP